MPRLKAVPRLVAVPFPARSVAARLRALLRHGIWIPVAAFVVLDGVPSDTLHLPIAAAAVVAGAACSHYLSRRAQRRSTRRLSQIIAALRRQAATFERDATTDRLTGLANRYTFVRALDGAMADQRHRPEGAGDALLLIDVDLFKQINDTFGHHVGDMALVRVARVLREETRESDLPTRLGGDEFAVIVRRAGAEGVRQLAARIRSAAPWKPVYTDAQGREARLSLSVGTALLADHADADSALIAADRDLYAAKLRDRKERRDSVA